jgi:prepilin-type N-terminal cleavage/methylation domain-containing protein
MRRRLLNFNSLNKRSMTVSMKRRAQSDDGLTLVELLVVLVITPLVLGGAAVGLPLGTDFVQ